MLVNTGITIAYKCSSCGSFKFFSVSLFNMVHKKEYLLCCHCNHSSIIITKDNFSNLKIEIPCIGCGSTHTSLLSKKDLFNKRLNVFYCPETGIPQCFIGADEEVRAKIDLLEKEFDELITRLGYDSYFNNTQVMFDVLNKIHDIAEGGNLYCECGNNDIELVLFPDKIQLKCKKCPGSEMIYAAFNKDLKDILQRQHILLQDLPVIYSNKVQK
ncbi:MAG: hypothetical protein N2645_02475 [Clostridia bacterium]|nr:hypothetical protein [Clostridia bacterium]